MPFFDQNNSYKISFNNPTQDIPGHNSIEIEEFEECKEIDEYIEKHYKGTKLFGYPTFTQNDIRENIANGKELLLLLQLDSNNSNGKIMVGDYGIMNFFITKEDLENMNFTNIIYNWDCY
ncbi:MAG: DUF1963 domain-containing protein [Candidatus Gracilibacteria bacterium]|nr:DUF1963 domain-containing protein [Candidatus Gracilibacteria bacterium]MCP4524098.1 DUF1963 domain-containing protein [Candidatus Gracilibacteria bacterium]